MKKYTYIILIISFLLPLYGCGLMESVKDEDEMPSESEQEQQKYGMNLFLKADQATDFKPSFSTGWKASSDDTKEVTIEGRGPNASEEGEAILAIKDKTTNHFTIYSLSDFEEHQSTFKYAEWIDGNRLFVIIGMAYGTVTQGGDLYLLNLENNEISLAVKTEDNEEFVDIRQQRDQDTFYFKKFIHNEDFNSGRYEEGKLTLSSIE